jgi:prephenate dehydrogenase
VIDRLAIVGLGLLGGSVARAARARSLAREIVAVGRDARRMETARRDGTVDRVTTDIADGLGAADFCVIATPVATLLDLLPAVCQALPAGAVLTDVGSTKARIVAEAERLGQARSVRFIGSHPMAGSEQTGYAVARADLFEGAIVILTPTERSDPDALAQVDRLWRALGARLVRLEPAAHDRAVAAISHLPHLVADALVDAVVRMDPAFLDLAARGFKDTTRIAAASPLMWREIFLDNRPALAEALAAFRKALDHLEGIVGAEDGPALERELKRIKQVRERLP